MSRLVLIRHGQTDWNVEGRWQGQADPPLSERGREEARRVARELRQFEFAALYSSDLRRALETAQIIDVRIGMTVIPEPRFREIHLGKWQEMLSVDIEAQYRDEFRRWHDSPSSTHPPGGEDIPALAARVLQAVNEIITRYPNQRVGIVTHELPIAVIACRSRGLDLHDLRTLITQTGVWQEVIVAGVLK